MEPSFLDNEALVDNLNDDQAKRVKEWLIHVSHTVPEDFVKAISLVREINLLFDNFRQDEWFQHLFLIEEELIYPILDIAVCDQSIFNQIMSQLEEIYDQPQD